MASFQGTMIGKLILSDWPKHLLIYLLGVLQVDGP